MSMLATASATRPEGKDMTNPYQPPAGADAMVAAERGKFVLAAIGAFLAAGYWALVTALTGLGAMMGTGSPANLVLPVVLIGLYAVRGYQISRAT